MAHKKIIRIDPLSLALPLAGVDSHAHLDGPEFASDRNEVLARARACGVAAIGNVFLCPDAYEQHKDYFAAYPEVFFLLGIHPCDGQSCTRDCLERIATLFAGDSRLCAVGEIGLDFHWDDCPREIQIQAFRAQLALARKLERPVVLHCREAEAQCLTILEADGFADYPLLWHCFGGDAALASRIVRNGWHISLPGPVTYPANSKLREAASLIPLERLLLETDAPYLAPVPWRGTRNESAYTVFTAHAVAEARGMAVEELWQATGANAARFFGLNC